MSKNESEVNTPLKTTSLDKEPAFVKLYVEHLLYFKELNYTETSSADGCSEKAMMVLFAIADRLSYMITQRCVKLLVISILLIIK